MANDEVLGPRKTMFVLVIVVGCFAVLWPRILSPLILGHTQEHLKPNQFDREAALKQERSPVRGTGPHPALRERGRAIPPGGPPPAPAQQRPTTQLPPHIRPPPIPGMRPPLGAPGGPVPAPKSSMGFVMPIYTICIIVFFVYTLSKILFKRTGTPYESIAPDPQFRRRVFRDDSRSSPDKLGPKERDAIVTAISGLVAEVRQQMEASDAQCQQRQEAQDNAARSYSNGTILLNSGPVQIIAGEFQDSKEKIKEEQKKSSELIESIPEEDLLSQVKEPSENKVNDLNKEGVVDDLLNKPVEEDVYSVHKESLPESEVIVKESISSDDNGHLKDLAEENILIVDEEQLTKNLEEKEASIENEIDIKENKNAELVEKKTPELNGDKLREDEEENINKDTDVVHNTEQFIQQEKGSSEQQEKSTPELLEEALREESPNDQEEEQDNQENSSVKVLGMEVTAHAADGGAWPGLDPPLAAAPLTQPHKPPHEADEVKSIFLETEIPQKARVLVADFAENRTDRTKPKHAPLVVSGKMTLSLIQDAPRETPERDPESTVDDYTTASAATHPLAEKEEDLSDEEIEEEIEIEEIEEEIEEEEAGEENEPKNTPKSG